MPERLSLDARPEWVDLARTAIGEVTSVADVGPAVDAEQAEDGVVTIRFAMQRPGYRGWMWTASLVQVPGAEQPTVLEVEVLPGEDALLAPEWTPWAERLAEFKAAQAAERAASSVDDEDGDDDADVDDDDFDGVDDAGEDDEDDDVDVAGHDRDADDESDAADDEDDDEDVDGGDDDSETDDDSGHSAGRGRRSGRLAGNRRRAPRRRRGRRSS